MILKGGPLPFILKKADCTDIDGMRVYSLLGKACVHGLSDGEGLRHLSDPGDRREWTRILLK